MPGSLLDLHIHDLDLIYWLLGRPLRVYGRGVLAGSGSRDAPAAWDHLTTALDYGAHQAWAEASFLVPDGYPFTMRFQLLGQRGALEYRYRAAFEGAMPDSGQPGGENALWAYPVSAPPQQIPLPDENPYEHPIAHFIGCVQRGQPPAFGTLTEARAVLDIALAAVQAADTGQIIEL